MGASEYRQAEEIRDALAEHEVRYLFIDQAGAILLGFPDTTQDADLFVRKDPDNGRRLVQALKQLGFSLTESRIAEIERGKDFVQIKDGPFDLDLVFAPTGSNGLKTLGVDMSRSKVFRSAIPTTSSPAKRRVGVPTIRNHSHD